MRGGRVVVLIPLIVGLACQDDLTSTDPECSPPERLIVVDFPYDTESLLEIASCELTTFGPSSPSDMVVSTSCGHWVEIEGVIVPTTALEVGHAIMVQTFVDDPLLASLGCAESGWLVIHSGSHQASLQVHPGFPRGAQTFSGLRENL